VIESDLALFKVGQPLRVTVIALPGRGFAGKVSRIYGVVDPDTHRGRLRAEIADPANELRPGMLANFVIQVRGSTESPAVPVNGVVREGDGTMTVWVTADRRYFLHRSVKLGVEADGRHQILDGVKRGELVVTDGAVFLSNMLHAPAQ
jgi:cobalt-zinc-cadmium efflux system membrane fusion protein